MVEASSSSALLFSRIEALSKEIHKRESEICAVREENRGLRAEIASANAQLLGEEEALSKAADAKRILGKHLKEKERAARAAERRHRVLLRKQQKEFESMLRMNPAERTEKRHAELCRAQSKTRALHEVVVFISKATGFAVDAIMPILDVCRENDPLLRELLEKEKARWLQPKEKENHANDGLEEGLC